MNRRSGATLVEVLVAIFVMALGLLALLVLFPLGALSMAQAIKDDRAAQAAANAQALAEIHNVRQDANALPYHTTLFYPTNLPPNPPLTPPLQPPPIPPGNYLYFYGLTPPYDGPGYPVYIDALGGQFSPTLGRVPGPTIPPASVGIRRVVPSYVPNFNAALRWFSLLDDMTFIKDGQGSGLAAQPLEREHRYSWAYLIRRPHYNDPAVVELSVIVYSGRPLSVLLGEPTYTGIDFDPSRNVVTVPYAVGQEKPPVRPGSWVLDATMIRPTGPNGPPYLPDPHGYFYRVVNVTDGIGAVQLELEQNPIQGTGFATPAARVGYGVLVVMENVVEVFKKGQGWKP